MIITIEPIHLFWVAIIGISLLGAAAAVGRWLISQAQQKTDAQVALLLEDSRKWSAVELQLMELRVELPERYVRREDYVRGETVIMARLDALYGKLDNLQLQGERNRGESK